MARNKSEKVPVMSEALMAFMTSEALDASKAARNARITSFGESLALSKEYFALSSGERVAFRRGIRRGAGLPEIGEGLAAFNSL